MSKFMKKIRTFIAKSGEGFSSVLHGLANVIYRKTRVGPVVTELKRRYTNEGLVAAVKFYRNETELDLYEAIKEVKRMAAKNGWQQPTDDF